MKRRTTIVIVSVGAVAAIAAGTVVAAGMNDDNSQPITGPALQAASAAALAYTGGGKVTETEVGDEESLYQVEVTMSDGTQIDVNLDKDFNVVAHKVDSESGSDSDSGADD